MSKHLIWLVPLALAGCKRSTVEAQNATVAEVAEKMKSSGVADAKLRPGLWQATVKLNNIAAPGAPQIEQQMRASVGQARTITECLTEENAKKPFERFVQGMSDDCKYDRFAMGDGKIDSKLVCSADGVTRTMTMQGQYDPTSYKLRMDTVATGGPVSRVDMSMILEAKRTGECPAKKAG